MNEEQGRPFEVVGDEAVEARIVAWVLGQASEFEGEELQRLCDEQPELEVFRRRIAAVHGLAAEAMRPPANDWKLSAERRGKVLAAVGAWQREARRERSSRIAARRVLWAIAACLVLTVAVFALLVPARAWKRGWGSPRGAAWMRPEAQTARALEEREGAAAEGAKTVTYSMRLPTAAASSARPDGEPEVLDARSTRLEPGDMIVVPQKNFWGDGGGKAKESEAKEVADRPAAVTGPVPTRPVASAPAAPAPSTTPAPAPAPPPPSGSPSKRRSLALGGEVVELEEPVAAAEIDGWVEHGTPVIGRLFRDKEQAPADGRPVADDFAEHLPEITTRSAGEAEPAKSPDLATAERWFDTNGVGNAPRGGTRTDLTGGVALEQEGRDDSGIVNGGLRSGDGAINRNSIDAVLSDPQRKTVDGKHAEVAAVTGTFAGVAGGGVAVQPEAGGLPAVAGKPATAEPQVVAGEAVERGRRSGGATWGMKAGTDWDAGELPLREGQAGMGYGGGAGGGAGAGSPPADAGVTRESDAELAFGAMLERGEGPGAASANRKRETGREAGGTRPSPEATAGELPALPGSGTTSLGLGTLAVTESAREAATPAPTEEVRYKIDTNEPAARADEVRKRLYMGSGNLELGKLDQAKKEFEKVLETDPHNVDARRGLERVAGAKTDYYRAAYDHTRAELLAEVDKTWELAVPADKAPQRDGSKPAAPALGFPVTPATPAEPAAESTPEARIEVIREFVYPTEFEPPAAGQPAGEDRLARLEERQVEATKLKVPAKPQAGRWVLEAGDRAGEGEKALQEAIAKQQAVVDEKRKVLNTIVETKSIAYKGGESVFGNVPAGADEDGAARSATMSYEQLEQEKVQVESQLTTLLKRDGEQLTEFAAGLNLPENTVKRVKPEYDMAKTGLSALKAQGLGDDHPRVKAQQEIIADYRKQLDDGVGVLRDTLRAQLDLTKERLGRMEELKKERRDTAVKTGIDTYDFVEAKEEFEQAQAELERLRGKVAQRDDPEVARRRLAEQQRQAQQARTKKAIDLMAEVAAADEPFSTFSLHVSDASFRVAAAAFARGERPEASAVRPEEFYNAFDYGDPAPTAGEPVACALEQCRHPLLPSRNLVRIAVRTAAAGRGAGQPLRLTVLLDNSGSMEREDRRAAVQAAAGQLAGLLGDGDVVSVIGFARQPRLLGDRLGGAQARGELPRLVAQTPAEGGTNLEAALALADEIAQRQFDAAAQNRIVLLTDGAANLGNADPEALARRIEQLRQRGIAFDAAGFGTAGLNDAMLERLTRDGNGRYYVVDRIEDAGPRFAAKLAGAFRPAAENVKVQVRFNPGRVAGYRLIGFEEHRLKKEDFRNDAVDAAEMAAEEAGVALYQVELLPGGEGEVGEVSVRFRDAAAGTMVERCWTIAHEPAAPGFDEAAPSLQLAGLAALAADVLRDGPLAPLTDWAELAPVVARVRGGFGNNARVAELAGMIEKLRE